MTMFIETLFNSAFASVMLYWVLQPILCTVCKTSITNGIYCLMYDSLKYNYICPRQSMYTVHCPNLQLLKCCNHGAVRSPAAQSPKPAPGPSNRTTRALSKPSPHHKQCFFTPEQNKNWS